MARVRPFAGWRYAGRDATSRGGRSPLRRHLPRAAHTPPRPTTAQRRRARASRGRARPVSCGQPLRDRRIPGTDGAPPECWSQTTAPAVYVLEQRFELAGRPVRRRAFIVEVGLEPFDAGVVLPHERTLPKALGDRFELIKATGANFSQVFGLFDDPIVLTDALFDAVMGAEPIAERDRRRRRR